MGRQEIRTAVVCAEEALDPHTVSRRARSILSPPRPPTDRDLDHSFQRPHQVVLHLLALDQEHCLQGSIVAPAGLPLYVLLSPVAVSASPPEADLRRLIRSPLLLADFHDLNNVFYASHFAMVHSRFSTNTFPSWDRAQPMRWAAHNGEINTVRGNKNWMRAREGVLKSGNFGHELDLLYPIIEEGGSDSAAFDNVLELLVVNGVLTLPEAVMMLVPEAWQQNDAMEPEKKAFYRWAACLMEPWDGPALFAFSDGRWVALICSS